MTLVIELTIQNIWMERQSQGAEPATCGPLRTHVCVSCRVAVSPASEVRKWFFTKFSEVLLWRLNLLGCASFFQQTAAWAQEVDWWPGSRIQELKRRSQILSVTSSRSPLSLTRKHLQFDLQVPFSVLRAGPSFPLQHVCVTKTNK